MCHCCRSTRALGNRELSKRSELSSQSLLTFLLTLLMTHNGLGELLDTHWVLSQIKAIPLHIASNIDASSLLRPRYLVKTSSASLGVLYRWAGIQVWLKPERFGAGLGLLRNVHFAKINRNHVKHEKGRGHQGGGETPLISRHLWRVVLRKTGCLGHGL